MLKKLFAASLAAGSLLPLVSAAGEVVTSRSNGVLALENGLTRLELRESDFALLSIVNQENGCEYVTGTPEGLFRLTMLEAGEKPEQWYGLAKGILFHTGAFGIHTAESFGHGGEGGWNLKLSHPGWSEGDLDITITVTMTEDSPLFSWDIAIDNKSSRPIQHLEFPYLSGLGVEGAEDTEYMAVPVYSGHKRKDIRKQYSGLLGYTEYPAGGMTIQLFTYEDGNENAFYFAAHDSSNYKKCFVALPTGDQKNFMESVIHYPDKPYAPGVWELAYPVVTGPFRGDWYDGCKMYRSWAITQPRWSQSLAEKPDVGGWFKDTPVWFQGNEWTFTEEALLEFADKIAGVREKLGYPMAFHWYIWQQYGKHDFNYPDYLPARPGFAEAVAKVQAAGVKVIPYLNSHLCETSLPIWRELELYKYAKRDCAGNLWRVYGVGENKSRTDDGSGPVDIFRGDQEGRDMVPMCVGTPVWQDVILAQAKGLIDEYNVDAIYWDETFCYQGLCYAKDHHHDWIGGTFHADGISELHRKAGALRPEGVFTLGENLGESYIDVCGALLNGHSDGNADSLPLFQTVYSDRTSEIGLFVRGWEFSEYDVLASKLAFNLLRGRVLGWFNSDHGILDIRLEKYAPQMELLKHFCDVRLAGLPWLYSGEMLRKPDMSALEQVTKIWQPWDSAENKPYVFPVVEGACYLAADGRLGLILVNMTDKEQQIEFPWNFEDWGGEQGSEVSRSEYRNSRWSASEKVTLDGTVKAELKPYEAIIISFSAE